jgi:hypothetical protein
VNPATSALKASTDSAVACTLRGSATLALEASSKTPTITRGILPAASVVRGHSVWPARAFVVLARKGTIRMNRSKHPARRAKHVPRVATETAAQVAHRASANSARLVTSRTVMASGTIRACNVLPGLHNLWKSKHRAPSVFGAGIKMRQARQRVRPARPALLGTCATIAETAAPEHANSAKPASTKKMKARGGTTSAATVMLGNIQRRASPNVRTANMVSTSSRVDTIRANRVASAKPVNTMLFVAVQVRERARCATLASTKPASAAPGIRHARTVQPGTMPAAKARPAARHVIMVCIKQRKGK